MTAEENRVSAYLRSLDRGHGTFLDELACRARERRIPVLRPETAAFLKAVVAAVKPRRILEVGTAVGYSALLMAQAMPERAHITTVESFAPHIAEARENFVRAGETERITLVEGDAGAVLSTLPGPYDFIFMDAAKGQYIRWLPQVFDLLASGGVLLSDNVFQDGDILESRFAVRRRDRTIHHRMREYLYALTHSYGLVTSILPVGDGAALSVKTEASGLFAEDSADPGPGKGTEQ